MSEVFFFSDPHFGSNYLSYIRGFGSTEEMDNLMFTNWEKTVGKKDVVWVLGDVTHNPQKLKQMRELPGRKQLILGNHDNFKMPEYIKTFSKIRGVAYFHRKFILTHVPVHPNEFDHRFNYNIHGHIHEEERGANWINVCVEKINYTPKPFAEIKRELRETA